MSPTVHRVGDRLRRLWDFDDLDVTEQRLQAQLEQETSDQGRAEVLTQIARVQGLRGQFAEGEQLLVEAERVAAPTRALSARINLERGRLLRSSGDIAGSLPLFVSAFQIAHEAGEEYLAADSAHMAALAAPERQTKLDWTQKGIEIAEASTDRQVAYWLGPLFNNLGCEYADAGEHEAALKAFERALDVRLRYPEMPEAIQHAKESVAEARGALGR